MSYDLVVRGGTVVDGSGMPRFRADVGVDGGRIVAVGRIDERGRREIDAEGHVVTPGFVDGHTHMDAQVFWDPIGSCSCYHGVTSVVMGNCGFSLAPAPESQRALVVRNLERAEDISGDAMAAGIPWSWDDFGSYLDAVDRLPKAINYAAYVGHSALRTFVMGERAFEQASSPDDLAAMRARAPQRPAGRCDRAVHVAQHEPPDAGRPPRRVAPGGLVRDRAAGRGDGRDGNRAVRARQRVAGGRPRPEARAEANDRLRRLAVDTGVPVTFGVLGAADPQVWRDQLALLDETAAEGGRMFAQTHCRGVSVLLSFQTRLPFDRLPEWAELPHAPPRCAGRPAAPTRGARAPGAGGERGRLRPCGRRRGARPRYDRIHVLQHASGPNPTLADLAASSGRDPVEIMIDLALDSELRVFFQQFPIKPDPVAIEEMLRHPRTAMTFSDSGAHVSQIMDSSIQTELLAEWVRRRQVFDLEAAVRMITLVPATLWGMTDRGLVREGMAADLNVIDPDTVAPRLPSVAADLPAGARRLVQKAQGIKATIVAGEPVLTDGEPTGALPGRLLRGRAADRRP